MKQFKNILCVVNPEDSAEYVIERAVALAENNQARLTVVNTTDRISAHVEIAEGGISSDDLQEAMINSHEQQLENLVEPYRERIEIKTRVLIGVPFLIIVREVLQYEHDLLIKLPGTCDWLDRLFSSDDMHLFRKCPCPVWIIKPQEKKTYRRILAAVDVDDIVSSEEKELLEALNQQILGIACSLALSDFAELHIVHVWRAIGESEMRGPFLDTPEDKITAYIGQVRQQRAAGLNKLLQGAITELGKDSVDYIKPQTHLVKGWPSKMIPELSKKIDADLVIMGTVARMGIKGLLIGNTAETILNQMDCSVLAIKPPGFKTPVTLED